MRQTGGFILTTDSRDEGGRCVLRFWGIGEEGPFVAVIDPHRPLFFVDRHAEVDEGLYEERRSLDLTDFEGNPMDGLYFTTASRARDAHRRLVEAGVRCRESDVRPEARFLMERFIHGSVRLEGDSEPDGRLTIWKNPRIQPGDWRPALTTLSLDIETGEDGTLYSVATHIWGPGGTVERVFVLGDIEKREGSVQLVAHESRLLEELLRTVSETDPDVLIGWHVIGFDLAFLERKGLELGRPLLLGRGHRPLKLIERPGFLPIADLEGRLVIDGPPALRTTYRSFPDWRLESVAQDLLGRGKDIGAHGREKIAEIERRFRDDKAALARYNLEDAVLVTEIFEKAGVLEQLVTRSLITGLPPDQVHRSIAAFDWFFLPRVHRKGLVANDSADVAAGASAPGGMVFTAGAGLYEDVAVLDFKSLYPTIIRTFRVDPYARLKADDHPLNTPAGIVFSRTEHILPQYLAELMERRGTAKAAGDEPLAQAIKILMNSIYGVMGTTGCRFYHADLPAAITGIGRWVLETAASRLRDRGYEVIYGDTDSLFVKLKTEERNDPDTAGRRVARQTDDFFRDLIEKEYGVTSRMELEYEKRYVRLFLPAMRGTGEGAVKRYAGLLPDGTVEIKGMEFVRSDTTPLARFFQHELFRRYFAGEDLAEWIRGTVADLREGEMDQLLVYRRRLSRAAGEYRKNVPPHVRAVRMIDPDGSRDLREVEYVITPEGPIPLELSPREIDYTHYVEKQIKPLADDVLRIQGRSFDEILGGRQLDLFGSPS